MKKLLLILLILSSFYVKGDIHQIQVWNGYYQFLPSNNITVQLGDTVQWVQLDPPTMTHTITSDNIPNGAIPFDQIWQLPADTFFQYIPQVVGLYQYVCTPHIPFGMIGEFTVVNGPQTYVPDDNFEAYLEANGMGNGIVGDDYVTTSSIDTVTILNVSYSNISDLTGIVDFTALTELNCHVNQITSLDVSQNTALTYLHCGRNQITSLDVSSNTALTTLICFLNFPSLTSLDVSGTTSLTYLDCNFNQITSLDVSTNTSLTTLY
jgi:Leucine-rich repeat (LRR) protein